MVWLDKLFIPNFIRHMITFPCLNWGWPILMRWAPVGGWCHRLTSCVFMLVNFGNQHDDVIKWKHFPRYWPFVRGIHRSTVNSPHKGQWRWALMFSFMCARINSWLNIREAGDLRRYRRHYDVIVMIQTMRNVYQFYWCLSHRDELSATDYLQFISVWDEISFLVFMHILQQNSVYDYGILLAFCLRNFSHFC